MRNNLTNEKISMNNEKSEKGFLSESRQKRFTCNEQHFFEDLFFYYRFLQGYVLSDLKVNKLTHQDVGLMQMYDCYFDRFVKQDFEKPSIGILRCQEKDDASVELTLPKERISTQSDMRSIHQTKNCCKAS